MTARSFISSHRNCRRFLAATHHAAILNNYSQDLQVSHFTVERGFIKKQFAAEISTYIEQTIGSFAITFQIFESAAQNR